MHALLRTPGTSRVAICRSTLAALVRPGLYLATLWAVVTLNFILPRLMPGDPLDALQDPTNGAFLSDNVVRGRVLAYYGLDRPLPEQYLAYLGALVHGDLGWSIRLNAPVGELIATRLPWTLLLVLPSLMIATIVASIAGVEAAWARGSALDRGLLVTLSLIHAVPVFVLGVLGIGLVAVQLRWLPLNGATTPFRTYATFWDQALDVLQHWLLPASVLVVEIATARFLLMRNTVLGVLNEQFITVARSKGASEVRLKYRHALPNALLPSITTLATQVGFALGGTIFVEVLFAYPGMGRLVADAVSARDYPVLQGAFLVVALATLLANAVADGLYGWLDPRTRTR